MGKTALICRFLEKDFPLKHKATSEQTNFGTYTLAGVKIKLEILDTSGKNEVCNELIRIIDFILSLKTIFYRCIYVCNVYRQCCTLHESIVHIIHSYNADSVDFLWLKLNTQKRR